MAVDSYAATSLAKAMASSLLDSFTHHLEGSPTGASLDPHLVSVFILGISNDIQAILGDDIAAAITMSPHKPQITPTRITLPRHLLPKSVCHDFSIIRRRAKAIRRLVKHEARNMVDVQEKPYPRDPMRPLWSSVNTPLPLRTVLSLPPMGLDTLGHFTRTDLDPKGPSPN